MVSHRDAPDRALLGSLKLPQAHGTRYFLKCGFLFGFRIFLTKISQGVSLKSHVWNAPTHIRLLAKATLVFLTQKLKQRVSHAPPTQPNLVKQTQVSPKACVCDWSPSNWLHARANILSGETKLRTNKIQLCVQMYARQLYFSVRAAVSLLRNVVCFGFRCIGIYICRQRCP